MEHMQDFNSVTSDVTAQRTLVLKGIPVLLGDKPNKFFKTASRTEVEEVIASMTVEVLTILCESGEYPPVSHAIVLEGSIVLNNIQDLPLAVCLLFGLTYALHLDYPKCMSYSLRFIQSVFLGLGHTTLPPKLLRR